MTLILKPPDAQQTADVTGMLASRQSVFQHMFPTGVHVEVAHIGRAPDSMIWLVVWSGPNSDPYPDIYPDAVLARVELDDRRQQTWAFMGDNAYDWQDMLLEQWDLEPKLQGIGSC